MKKLFYVALMAMMVMMTACQQSKEDYIKEFKSFVEEVSEECEDYTEADWEDAAKEFEALVKKAEQYEDITAWNIHQFLKPECQNIFKEFCNESFFESIANKCKIFCRALTKLYK